MLGKIMSDYEDATKALAAANGIDPLELLSRVNSLRQTTNGGFDSFHPDLVNLPSQDSTDVSDGGIIAEKQELFFKFLNEELYRSAGLGSFYNSLQTNLSQINRYGPVPFTPNRVMSGYTFITRPQLNLSLPSIRSNRILSTLETYQPIDVNFMIRGLLDPRWYATWIAANQPESVLLDFRNPWLTPLVNNLTSITGFPDLNIDTDPGKTGFFNEKLTIASGSNRLKHGADLSLTFREISGGIIFSLFHIWLEYMAAVTKNEVTAYAQEIDQRRLNYTVSIYRFLLTPDRRHIQHCAKATGCFPVSLPVGNLFNMNQNELSVKGAQELTIPFIANVVEFDDPIIPLEFNMLAKRYWNDIDNLDSNYVFETPAFNPTTLLSDDKSTYDPSLDVNDMPPWMNSAFDKHLRWNYVGLPYIKYVQYKGLELVFRYYSGDGKGLDYNSPVNSFENIKKALITAKENRHNNRIKELTDLITNSMSDVDNSTPILL
jgi:hypothetical protein